MPLLRAETVLPVDVVIIPRKEKKMKRKKRSVPSADRAKAAHAMSRNIVDMLAKKNGGMTAKEYEEAVEREDREKQAKQDGA